MSKHAKSAGRTDLPLFDAVKDVTIIGIDVEVTPENRHLCDEESNATPVVEHEILFAMVHGVLQPVIGQRDGDTIVIVAGRGRVRKLRAANERLLKEGSEPWKLPVIIKRGDEATMVAIATAENLHRRKISPIWRAHQANLLLEKGKSKAEVASLIDGVTEAQLENILLLLQLSTKVARAVTSGAFSATAAAVLADLPKAEQDAKLDELISSGEIKATVKETINKVRAASGKAPVETPKDRIAKAIAALDKLDDGATKDDLWSTVKKVRSALEGRKK